MNAHLRWLIHYYWSSLFYKMNPKQERHSATWVSHERRKCNTSATLVQHQWNTSVTWLRHECDTNDMVATPVKQQQRHGTSENIFSFLRRFIFFFLKKFIILDFVNFPQKIHHKWKIWRAINKEFCW